MSKTLAWQQFERDVQDALGLDATTCSGNKFNDIGDATDNRPPQDNSFRLLVDCKFTESSSYSLSRKTMQQWIMRGVEQGKRAIMAIRLWPRGTAHEAAADYVVIALDDFAELYERASRIIELDAKLFDALDQMDQKVTDPVHPSTYTPGCPNNEASLCGCTDVCKAGRHKYATPYDDDEPYLNQQKPGIGTWSSDGTYLERDDYKRTH